MLDKNNEVFFGEYCRTCKYKNYSETDSPCAECIAEPVNLYSHKPVKWEGADGIFSGPPPRPDHAYERAVKYIPEKRKDKEKAFARQNIDAEYAGNKVQSLDGEVTEDQYPSAKAVKEALKGQDEVVTRALADKIDAPSGCACGEFLAVEEVDEEGKPTKIVTKEAETAAPDLDENDPTKPGYVKNRTHWKEEIPYTVIAYASVPATDEHILYGDINEAFAKLLNDSNVSDGVDTIVVDGVSVVSKRTGFTSWHQYYDTVIFKGDIIDECKISKQKNVLQLTMSSSSGVTFEVGTEHSIQFLNAKQTSPLYHTLDAEYIPIGSGLKVEDQKIVSTVGQKYAGGTSESAGDVFNDVTNNKASASYSHAEGFGTTASGSYGAHAEGYRTIASGSHGAHAEGDGTEAQGHASHAEGTGTEAQGNESHAEGYYTIAKSMDSHTEGRYTVASNDQQHVQGRSNIEDTERKYAHIVGNGTTAGTSSKVKRSNAHTLDWDGNAWFAGDVYVGSDSGTNRDEGSLRLATVEDIRKQYIIDIYTNQDDSGNITYTSELPAMWIFDTLYGIGSRTGNSIICCLHSLEDTDTPAILNFISDDASDLNDGNVSLSYKFSSIISGKVTTVEIKDTISGFLTDDMTSVNSVVTVTEETMTVPCPANDAEGSVLKAGATGLLEWVKDNSSLPSPTTAQVGQIVKVKAVDADGKITETEAVDAPTQKTLKWLTVHSSDLTETKTDLIISTDADGKAIADYEPIGLSLIISTPADATVESNNGSPWVYPSATKSDNVIRVIGNISGWKTIARDSVFIFNGSSSAMSCTGNVNTSLATYKLDGYALDGVKIFFNNTNDHLPIGTHIEVAILCEISE